MRYNSILKFDSANGKGIRTTIWFTGCKFHCKECFNSQIWDFNSGLPFDSEAKNKLFDCISNEHVKGLSVLGGEPLQQGEEMYDLLKEVKEKFPNKDIWLWTGYYINELNDLQKKIISLCDYVVDGRFDESKKDVRLYFRGSSNQTIWKNNHDGTFSESNLNTAHIIE